MSNSQNSTSPACTVAPASAQGQAVRTFRPAPRDLAAIAADLGEPLPGPAVEVNPWRPRLQAIANRLARRPSVAGAQWRSMSVELRGLLLTICTNRRNCVQDAQQPWESFTEEERITIGATARQWRGSLEGAGVLR